MTEASQKFASITALGLMSGTSLDGLDLALCQFKSESESWAYDWIATEFVAYGAEWKGKLVSAYSQPIHDLGAIHQEYGRWIGTQVNRFLKDHARPKLICSHGHTVKHQPANGFTFQLGDGQTIATKVGITTISDFRSKDISLGGQGAPLVPIGDQLLFSEFDACLNIGGFSNISFEADGIRTAFDICPVNIVLNELAMKLGRPYDAKGEMARSGLLDQTLLDNLMNACLTEQIKRPSLSREWVESKIDPLLRLDIPVADKLRTMTEYAAIMISQVINNHNLKKVLITGGGAYNVFLMERTADISGVNTTKASDQLIEFKEALIFGFLGVLRWYDQINVLSSVTGACKDSISGEIFNV